MKSYIEELSQVISKLCLSVKSKGFSFLDKILVIDESIMDKRPLSILYEDRFLHYIYIFIVFLIFISLVQYIVKLNLNIYLENKIENIYFYIIKVIIVCILSLNSYSICRSILYLNNLFTNFISSVFEENIDEKVEFNYLKDEELSLNEILELDDKVSLEGVIDVVTTIFILYMIIILSFRYVYVIFIIFISPFLILLYLNNTTKKILKYIIITFFFCLIIQIINKFILFILILSKENKEMYSVMLMGSFGLIYVLCSKIKEIKII